jgi:tetratricopeptide (TPR) repeat protein
MNSIIHETGWRIALYCLFVGAVSLFSMLALIGRIQQERRIRIQAEVNDAMRIERGETISDEQLAAAYPSRRTVRGRALFLAAHTLVIAGSLTFALPALKAARYTHLGNEAFVEHNYDEAVKAYDIALATDPQAGFLNAQFQTAIAQRDDKGGEVGELRRLMSLHPGDAALHNRLGAALMQKGDGAHGIQEFQRAVALKPENSFFHNNLGNALRDAHRYTEAIATLRKALQLNPDQAPTYYNLANTLLSNRQTDEAVKYYRIAIEKDPRLAPAYYDLAQALETQGKRAEAIATMETFLRMAARQPEMADAMEKANAHLARWRGMH